MMNWCLNSGEFSYVVVNRGQRPFPQAFCAKLVDGYLFAIDPVVSSFGPSTHG